MEGAVPTTPVLRFAVLPIIFARSFNTPEPMASMKSHEGSNFITTLPSSYSPGISFSPRCLISCSV